MLEESQTLAPLRGIIHAAGVLDDGILLQQTVERFEKVMAPKVQGSWYLHTLSEDLPLDFFVCFSSFKIAYCCKYRCIRDICCNNICCQIDA